MNFSYFGKMDVITGLLLMISLILSRLHGFTREIIAVSFDENGKRIERDCDLIPEEEKQEIRRRTSERMIRAAGYVPVEKENKGK